MIYKACSRCGKIHPHNYDCTVGKVYKASAERELRNKYQWAKKSREIRESAMNLCEVCKDQGIYNYKQLEVHHIERLADSPEKLLDNYNLICLCAKHHKDADANMIDVDYLKRLALDREKR